MIKGVSDQRRLPRLGHLRLGVKKKSQGGAEYPSEVDYFVIDPKTPDEKRNQELKDEFHKLYGEKPKSVTIMFPPVPPELFFAQFYKRYGSSTLVKCKGDGELATTTPEFAEGLKQVGEDERGFIQVECLGSECIYQNCKKPQCSRMACLQIILPELKGIGIWQINTGSYNSIVNMNSAVDWLKGLCGRYAMIPITLMRVPQDIQYEGKKSKHFILQIDQDSLSIGDIQRLALRPEVTSLIPPADESKDALFYDAPVETTPLLEQKKEIAKDPLNPTRKEIEKHQKEIAKTAEIPVPATPEFLNEIFARADKSKGVSEEDIYMLCREKFEGKEPKDLTQAEAEALDTAIVALIDEKKPKSNNSITYTCEAPGCKRTIVKGTKLCSYHKNNER
jgi:hypothetical protein